MTFIDRPARNIGGDSHVSRRAGLALRQPASFSHRRCANHNSPGAAVRVEKRHRSVYNQGMDHHTVAAVSITGTCLDVLGSLYLAYDLLGGQHGPLRLLTRAVTYSIVFGMG